VPLSQSMRPTSTRGKAPQLYRSSHTCASDDRVEGRQAPDPADGIRGGHEAAAGRFREQTLQGLQQAVPRRGAPRGPPRRWAPRCVRRRRPLGCPRNL
jgi:hypothetical protein